jgi:hypothetical protein
MRLIAHAARGPTPHHEAAAPNEAKRKIRAGTNV